MAHEGDGIKIVADGNDRWVYNWNVSNVNVQYVGGYGLDVRGSVFEGMVSNSWMSGNGEGGAYFAHSATAVRPARSAGSAAASRTMAAPASPSTMARATWASTTPPSITTTASGISAMSGITSVTDSTFVNNQGRGRLSELRQLQQQHVLDTRGHRPSA